MDPDVLSVNASLLHAVGAAGMDDYLPHNGSLTAVLRENSTPGADLSAALVAANVTAGRLSPDGVYIAKKVMACLSYLIGILGNAAALYILWSRHRARRPRSSSKHAIMLCCLVCNDLVALLGMLSLMIVHAVLPEHLLSPYWLCVARVVWRLFGLGSGCVAGVMALERWLALTHPFLYQKHVTVQVILFTILILWGHVLILVCLPFTGFGLYMKNGTCQRYRDAKEPIDIAYAFLFFTFGALLCLCIVWCNLAVVRALCHMELGKWNSSCSRRISRQSMSSSSNKQLCRRSTLNKMEVVCSQNRVCEITSPPSNFAAMSDESEHLDELRREKNHRLLKTSFRSNERDSIHCDCASCSSNVKVASNQRSNGKNEQLCYNVCTSEEVAFARLMTVLSIFFVVCWAPQMISILLAQFSTRTKATVIFYYLSDIFMSLHFTIDPYVYVVLRNYQQKRNKKPCMRIPILKLLCRQCSNQSQITNEVELTERCVSHDEVS